MLNGIINVYKPAGFTSFDVVAKLRGIIHQKKIGHTGTLDPEAVGVLPVCLGNATRVCELLTDRSKTYEALVAIGVETDTQDLSGSIISIKAANGLCEADFTKAARAFIGEYDQLPPMYSAKKVNGKKLYELARQGIEIERKPSKVVIHSLEVMDFGVFNLDDYLAGSMQVTGDENKSWQLILPKNSECDLNEITKTGVIFTKLVVSCSKGTYIRTLCHDIGKRLELGACMAALKRVKAGPFLVENALTIDEIQQLSDSGRLEAEALLSTDSVFMEYPAVHVKSENEKALYNGNELKAEFLSESDRGALKNTDFCRVYDSSNVFKAVYCIKDNGRYLKPYKMFL